VLRRLPLITYLRADVFALVILFHPSIRTPGGGHAWVRRCHLVLRLAREKKIFDVTLMFHEMLKEIFGY
jgi:hypothetical protein